MRPPLISIASKIAPNNGSMTLKRASEAAKAAGYPAARGREILALVEAVKVRRLWRYPISVGVRTRAREADSREELGRRFSKPLEKRIQSFRKEEIRDKILDSKLRTHEVKVNFGKPKAFVSVEEDRTIYKGRFKGYPHRTYTLEVTVPKDWRLRVQKKGLAVLDGLFTLDAEFVESELDVEVFKAYWLEAGRGYSVNLIRGYIAKSKYRWFSYHGDSAEKAKAGLARKIRAEGSCPYGSECVSVATLAQALGRKAVTWADTKRVGACRSGVISRLHRVGIDPNRKSVPANLVYEAYKREPAPEVRAILLAAATRQEIELA